VIEERVNRMQPHDAEFSDLYRAELAPQVRRAYLLLHDHDAANDVVHEAMVGLYRMWTQVDRPAAYLNRAVLNGCRDAGRRGTTADAALRRSAPTAGDVAPHEPLADVLKRLPFQHRAAIVLRYYAGFTTSEIAETLDCAPGSVGPWIERGLAAMRKVL
jgi:RNA polymerase sigma factor (sigma-70 family)